MMWNALKRGCSQLAAALGKAGALLGNPIRALFKGQVDERLLEELERILYEADLGRGLVEELVAVVRKAALSNPSLSADDALLLLRKELEQQLGKISSPLSLCQPCKGPTVIAIVGINGNGKTTSVAKLGHWIQQRGKKVLLAAADTYRAAATEQLSVWGDRLSLPVVRGTSRADPAAIAFDAITAGIARECDAVIIDTAGRLHTKVALMQELEKLRRSCHKALPGAPHESLLVLDAHNGQNGIEQAHAFHRHFPLTGLIVTKLDGTGKGGVVFQIVRQLALPVKFIGVGEGVEDLQPFDPSTFCTALLQ